jgi:hypothetical protein
MYCTRLRLTSLTLNTVKFCPSPPPPDFSRTLPVCTQLLHTRRQLANLLQAETSDCDSDSASNHRSSHHESTSLQQHIVELDQTIATQNEQLLAIKQERDLLRLHTQELTAELKMTKVTLSAVHAVATSPPDSPSSRRTSTALSPDVSRAALSAENSELREHVSQLTSKLSQASILADRLKKDIESRDASIALLQDTIHEHERVFSTSRPTSSMSGSHRHQPRRSTPTSSQRRLSRASTRPKSTRRASAVRAVVDTGRGTSRRSPNVSRPRKTDASSTRRTRRSSMDLAKTTPERGTSRSTPKSARQRMRPGSGGSGAVPGSRHSRRTPQSATVARRAMTRTGSRADGKSVAAARPNVRRAKSAAPVRRKTKLSHRKASQNRSIAKQRDKHPSAAQRKHISPDARRKLLRQFSSDKPITIRGHSKHNYPDDASAVAGSNIDLANEIHHALRKVVDRWNRSYKGVPLTTYGKTSFVFGELSVDITLVKGKLFAIEHDRQDNHSESDSNDALLVPLNKFMKDNLSKQLALQAIATGTMTIAAESKRSPNSKASFSMTAPASNGNTKNSTTSHVESRDQRHTLQKKRMANKIRASASMPAAGSKPSHRRRASASIVESRRKRASTLKKRNNSYTGSEIHRLLRAAIAEHDPSASGISLQMDDVEEHLHDGQILDISHESDDVVQSDAVTSSDVAL